MRILILSYFPFHSFAQQFGLFESKAAEFHGQFSRYFKSSTDEKAIRSLVLDNATVFKRDSTWSLSFQALYNFKEAIATFQTRENALHGIDFDSIKSF